MFKSDLVKSDTANLYFEMFVVAEVARFVQLCIYAFFNREFLWLGSSPCLNLSNCQFRQNSWRKNCRNWLAKRICLSKLADMANKFSCEVNIALFHLFVQFLTTRMHLILAIRAAY